MASTPTLNPVPSENYDDMRFNAGKLDEFVTSPDDEYTDRFGVTHLTARGLQNSVAGALLPANNLSDLANKDSSLSNLGGGATGINVFKSATSSAARSAIAAAASGSNTDITALSGLTTALSIPQGGTGAATAANARTNLGLGSIATQNANAVTITGGTISGITDLAIVDGGTGASDAPTARTNLGLGSIATQSAGSVAITGGSISGITDLAIADGGTGASTASAARANLGAKADAGVTDGSNATTGQVGEVLTVTTNATANASTTAVNTAQISLTAGDWEVSGSIRLNSNSAPYTVFVAGFNTASATQPIFPNAIQLNVPTSPTTQQAPVPTIRLNVSATTTIYLVALAIFASGTSTVDGYIRARRVR